MRCRHAWTVWACASAFFGPLASVVRCGEADPSSLTFVRDPGAEECLELRPDGTLFWNHYGDFTRGRYTKDGGAYACEADDGWRVRLQPTRRGWVGCAGDSWSVRGAPPAIPWRDLRPVTFVVCETGTGRPVPAFAYNYSIRAPGRRFDPQLTRPIEVVSETGEFSLDAPVSCRIHLDIVAQELVGGDDSEGTYDLTSRDSLRRIQVAVRRGLTVSGRVVSARTGGPIPGAVVSPVVFERRADRGRSVTTDGEGCFTVQGVDPDFGYHVWHEEHVERWLDFRWSRHVSCVTVVMEAGREVAGTIRDPDGNALAGAIVTEAGQKSVLSGDDGRFAFRLSRSGYSELRFHKDGYVSRTVVSPSDDLSVVLEPAPTLRGQVLDRDGRPVSSFEVFAGPGPEPERYQCSWEGSGHADGRFALALGDVTDFRGDRAGRIWVGVRAHGYAMWETSLEMWAGVKTVPVRLSPGCTVRGAVRLPAGRNGPVLAMLLPARTDGSSGSSGDRLTPRQILGMSRTEVGAKGDFRLPNATPGRYSLHLFGDGVSPKRVSLDVAEPDTLVGAVPLAGTGTIHGFVHVPPDEGGGVWPFASGHVRFDDEDCCCLADELAFLAPIEFQADEDGWFEVESCPAGTCSVEIPIQLSADMFSSHARTAIVREGATTEVRFFDPSGEWELPIELTIGDGSTAQHETGTGQRAQRVVENVTSRPPMFLVHVWPAGDGPASWGAPDWEELDDRRRLVVEDLQPGRYALSLLDWLGSRGFSDGVLIETEVEVRSRGEPLRLRLGAGCISGGLRWDGEYDEMIEVIAVGARTKTLRRARCDAGGNFGARYLQEDTYTLLAHDDSAGWCRVDDVIVRDDSTDVGVHALRPGGTIRGNVVVPIDLRWEASVVAVDSRSIPFEIWLRNGPGAQPFSISSLWPDTWTVSLRRGAEVVATRSVTIRGLETVDCDPGVLQPPAPGLFR